MRSEIDLQKYSQFLGQGLFADNVVLALIDYKEKGHVDDQGKAALKRAKVFLDEVINGGNLQKKKFSSSQDIKVAKTFNSLQAMKTRRPPDLIREISELRDSIDAIINNKPIKTDEIDQLDDFFAGYGLISFQRSNSILETV